jgi:hypothetical protein
MTIAKKLLIGFGGTLGLSLLVSGVGLVNLGRLSDIVNLLASPEAKKHALASEMNTLTSDLIAPERGILVRSFMKDSVTGAKYQEDFQESLGRLRQGIDEFAPLAETAEERNALDELRSSIMRAMQGTRRFLVSHRAAKPMPRLHQKPVAVLRGHGHRGTTAVGGHEPDSVNRAVSLL